MNSSQFALRSTFVLLALMSCAENTQEPRRAQAEAEADAQAEQSVNQKTDQASAEQPDDPRADRPSGLVRMTAADVIDDGQAGEGQKKNNAFSALSPTMPGNQCYVQLLG